MMAGESPFRLVWSGVIQARVRALNEVLLARGHTRRELAEAIQRIEARLQAAPLEAGEPHNRLPHSGMILCVGFGGPYRFAYGAHEELRLVIIRSVHIQHEPGAPAS